MKLILPMAGNGQRFFDEGYLSIKPLIDIKGAPMFKRVVENIGLTEDIICKSNVLYYPFEHWRAFDIN
jgi:hypothetical protein